MKKILLTTVATICLLALVTSANAAPDPNPIQTTVTANVGVEFSIAFDTDSANVSYPGAAALTSAVDATSNLNYLDNHTVDNPNTPGVNEGKPDIGIICKSNENQTWYLKTSLGGTIPAANMLYYMGQPTMWTGTGSVLTNGSLANQPPAAGQQWPNIPNGGVVYTSGANDTINTPFGTYCGMDIGIDGTGLSQGSNQTGIITFTLTQNP